MYNFLLIFQDSYSIDCFSDISILLFMLGSRPFTQAFSSSCSGACSCVRPGVPCVAFS